MDQNQPEIRPNPYDFITNPGQPPKKPLLAGSSLKGRILVFGGGIVLLLILISVGSSLLSSIGKGNQKALIDIVNRQQELIRVAEIGTESALSTTTRSLAMTTKLSITSHQQALIAELKDKGVKLEAKNLTKYLSKNTDAALQSATTNNKFDETFEAEIKDELSEYVDALTATYDGSSDRVKNALSTSYTSAAAILGLK